MKLLLLGTTGYHANDRRHTSCFLIPEHGIMLDAGTGLFRAATRLRTAELDIFLTHAHLDHCIGLTFLLGTTYVRPLERVRVHGETEKLSAIEEHLFTPLLFPKRPAMEMVPLEGPVALRGEGRLTHFPLEHAGGTVGYRLDWPGHSMAYVTDTTASADAPYVEEIRGVDLLVHECYFPDRQSGLALRTHHSHTTPVAEVARRARAGRLVLVHVNPLATEPDPIGLDVARAIFPRTELGEDLMEVEF